MSSTSSILKFIANIEKNLEELESSMGKIEAELNIMYAVVDIIEKIHVKTLARYDFEIYSVTGHTSVKEIRDILRNDIIKVLCGVLGGLLNVEIESCECMDKVVDSLIDNYQSYDSRLRSLSIYGQYRELLGNYVKNCMSGDVCKFLDYLLEGKVEKVLGSLFSEFDALRGRVGEFGIGEKLVSCFIRPCNVAELVNEMSKLRRDLGKLVLMSRVFGELNVAPQASAEHQSLWMSKVSNLVRELDNVSEIVKKLKVELESIDTYREDCIPSISRICSNALNSISDGLSRIKSTMSTISTMIDLAKKRGANVDDVEKSAKNINNCVEYLGMLIRTDTDIPTNDRSITTQCQDINKHLKRLMERDLSEVIEKELSGIEREVLSKILEVLGVGTTRQISIRELAERLSEQELITLTGLCRRGILTCVVGI